MAIQYGDYAGGQRSGVDMSPLAKGLESAIASSDERLNAAVANYAQDSWSALMKPFENAAFSDINSSTWTLNTSMLNINPGQALAVYKSEARKKGSRFYDKLAAAGEFNPMVFKQKYDEMRASFTPTIERKLEKFKDVNGWNDRTMQQYIGRNPNLQNYLLDHGSPESPMRELARPYTPAGLIPGAYQEVMRQPMGYAASLGPGAGIMRGIGGAWKARKGGFAGALGGFKTGFGKGLKQTWKLPFESRINKTKLSALTKKLEATGVGKSTAKRTAASLKKETQELANARRSRTVEVKKNKNWLTKTDAGKKNTALRNNLKKKISNLRTKSTKSAQSVIKRYTPIHGKRGLYNLVSKKLGKSVARKMVLKGLFSIGLAPFTGGLSLAMNAWMLWDLAKIAKEALAETGGLRGPRKMLFGGRSSEPLSTATGLTPEHQAMLDFQQQRYSIK